MNTLIDTVRKLPLDLRYVDSSGESACIHTLGVHYLGREVEDFAKRDTKLCEYWDKL